MDLTIEQYAKKFKMSTEMVASKIRQKKLNYTSENGEILINVPDIDISVKETKKEIPAQTKKQASTQKNIMQKATVATVLGLYKRENTYLKQKIEQLEAKIDRLIDDKEQMLIDERNRIEGIYTNKDEQLKNILELINEKIILEKEKNNTVYEIEHSADTDKIIELKAYLKTLDLKSSQRKAIKKRFEDALKDDVRVLEQNGKIYIDLTRYDYSDLLAL